MIGGSESEKRKRQLAFELQNARASLWKAKYTQM